MPAATDAIEVTITDDDGETDTIELPAELIDRLGEAGDTPATVVADVAVLSLTGRAHALVHHAEDDPDPGLEDVEARMLDLFEDRFGMTYAEATGHAH